MFARPSRTIFSTGLLFFFLAMATGSPVFGQGFKKPLDVIQSGTDQALKIMNESRSGTGPTLKQRRSEILVIVDQYFNFYEMAKRALGREWKEQPPDKQQEFVRLFKQLLFNSYVDKVEAYTGSNEQVVYDHENTDGDYSYVKTRIKGYKNKDVQVDYRLRREAEGWKAYDVIVEGISLVDNYRNQFTSILSSQSFDAMMKLLKQKAESPRATAEQPGVDTQLNNAG